MSRGPGAARPRRHLPRGRLDQRGVPAVRPVGDLRAGRGPLALAQEGMGLLVAELRPPPRLPQTGRVRRALPAGPVAGDQPAARRRSAAAASTVHTVGPAHHDDGRQRAADEEAGRRSLAVTDVAEHEAFRLNASGRRDVGIGVYCSPVGKPSLPLRIGEGDHCNAFRKSLVCLAALNKSLAWQRPRPTSRLA